MRPLEPNKHSRILTLSRSRRFQERLIRPPEFRVVTIARLLQMTQVHAGKLPGWHLLRWMRQGN